MKEILTSNGMNLILRGLAGSTIEFTKIKFGNGEEQGVTAVDLNNPIMEVPISSITRDSNFITLIADYKNADVPTDFSALEIGVFAKDPDDATKEILYCLWYEDDPVKADYISPVEDRMLGTKMEILVFVDTVENVTAVMSESTEAATKAELLQHTDNSANPHNVTKDQVGLGNVPNVTAENLQPAFDEEIGPVSVSVESDRNNPLLVKRVTSFPNIEKGDVFGAMVKKIRTGFSVLLSHINGNNPHGLSAKSIGAAAETHYHSANQINKGILGIPRGGTGGGTASDARVNLGIQAGVGRIEGEKGKEVFCEITFPAEFSTAPSVVITPKTAMFSSDVYLSVSSVTTKGFTARVYSSAFRPLLNFYWVAIQ